MRLSTEQVKQGLLHADKEVRTEVAYCFSRSYSRDPALMPLLIEAIEKYGWDEAFGSYNFFQDLVQSGETIRWMIEQLRRLPIRPKEEEAIRRHEALLAGLLGAEPELLRVYEDEIGRLDGFGGDARDAFNEWLMLEGRQDRGPASGHHVGGDAASRDGAVEPAVTPAAIKSGNHCAGTLERQRRRTEELIRLLLAHRIRVHRLRASAILDGETYDPDSAFVVPVNQPQMRLLTAMLQR